MKLDFVIPGSATPAFFSQIAFFRLCLDALGGHYADARVAAVLGDHDSEDIPERWRRHLGNVDVIWAHPPGANNPMHQAQSDGCFQAVRPDADVAFLCDADVAPMRPFDDLLHRIVDQPALAGVIAHYHFAPKDGRPLPQNERTPETDWPDLARAVIGKPLRLQHRYTLMEPESPQRAPFYINYAVLAGTPQLLKRLQSRDKQIRPKVLDLCGAFWAYQISLALTVVDLDLPTVSLPMRYNFPNDPIADRLYPQDLNDIAFLHYLRPKQFDRQKIFADPHEFERFLDLPLRGSNAIFQEFVRLRTNGKYPFA